MMEGKLMRAVSPVCAVDARMANHSGIGVYFRNIFQELVKRGGVQFQVLAPRDYFDELAYKDGLEFTEVTSPIYSMSEQLELPRKLSAASKCLWTPHYNMPLFARCARLVTVHDIAHLAESTINNRFLPRIYARTMLSAVRERADNIFFVSRFSESEFNRVIGAPRGITAITSNAASNLWHSQPTQSLLNAQQRWLRPYLVFVGNVKPHKNIGGLLEALALINEEDRPDLRIVGRRDGFFHSDETVERLAGLLGDKVTFTGEVSDDALVEIVRNAVALVQPSFYEGFGIPPLEAMAVGTPVLVSDIPALQETCGDAALYFDPRDSQSIANKICLILQDNHLRKELSLAGHERCAQFSYGRSADIILAAMIQQLERR